MTIDTRLVNARLVDGTGVHHGSLSIDDGRLIPDQETDDVWRTVDASGHLVFPGVIQSADPAGESALDWAKRGTTTAIVGAKPDQPFFDWLAAVEVSDPDRFSLAIERGARALTPRGISASDAPNVDRPIVLRLDQGSGDPANWLHVEHCTLVVGADLPGAIDLADDERVVIEISAPALLADDSEHLWDLVNSDSRVLVTSGGDLQFPLLHFLYHEGHIKRGVPLSRVAGLISLIAAEVYGLVQKSGYDIGQDGDLVVFDPDAADPYLDSQWPGRVIFSLQRGNILLYNGQLHTVPGDGRRVGHH